MLLFSIFFVILAQVFAQDLLIRIPRKAQSVYDVDPPRRNKPAYDFNPPVYGVNPPRRNKPAYDVNPPRRHQPAYDVNPPRRNQPAYDVNPPAYDVNPPLKNQPAYDVNPPAYDVKSPAYDVDPPAYGVKSPAYDVDPPAYDVQPRSQAETVVKSASEAAVTDNPNADIIPKNKVAYWVEPYRGESDGVKGTEELEDQPMLPPPVSVVTEEPKCILPPLPEHGSYAKNDAEPTLRAGSEIVTLTVTCDKGHSVHGPATVHCYNGFWADKMPKCLPITCQLKQHHSVEYRCLVIGDIVGSRVCSEEEPVGTIVSPRCRKPHYYSTSNNLAFMHCGEDGTWDHVVRCTPECGTVTADGRGLVVGGQSAKRGELPWHVGIYSKTFTPYKQVCGGSLISNKLIISAAHCFWNDIQKQLPATDFAVAVGKLYRPWDDKMDDSQTSDVKEIHLPPRFQGASSNFQDDIAVLISTKAFEYRNHVRPVCLSFDSHFDRLQLQTVNMGKVAGWGLTAADGKAAPVLQVVELPYVEVGTCIEHSPPTFLAHITSDKICAGTQNTSAALCRGDSGGGLTFKATDRDTPRYYLRGVVSTAPSDEHACNTATYTSFTHVQKHEDFIKQFITDT